MRPGSPAASQALWRAAANHIVIGYADGTFKPNNPITRVQLSKIVTLVAGWTLIDPLTPTFRDVPRGSTFYKFVETAVRQGVLGGYDCGAGCREFRPGNDALRGQIAKIVYNALAR